MQIAVQRIAADADDLERSSGEDVAVAGVHTDRNEPADRILVRKARRGQTLIDDSDFRRRGGVVLVERPPSEHEVGPDSQHVHR